MAFFFCAIAGVATGMMLLMGRWFFAAIFFSLFVLCFYLPDKYWLD
jgi:hypothetical protein